MEIPKYLKEVDGMLIPAFFSTECFRSALRYKPKAGDIFIATYPKCGTTWMQNIVINILRQGNPLDRPVDFLYASPFLDQLGAEDSLKFMIRPGALKTHLPFHRVPWSDEAKYIYVARNPKDCCVSFFYHVCQLPCYEFSANTFEDFFELFIRGKVEFGDYFDHLTGWYEQRDRSNILFITYEELKKSTRDSVLKIAEFLGEEYHRPLKEDPEQLDKIVSECSIGRTKTFINAAISSMYSERNREALLSNPNIPEGRKYIIRYNATLPNSHTISDIEFVRKGIIGDWINHFTHEQSDRLSRKLREKTKGTDIMKLWSDISN